MEIKEPNYFQQSLQRCSTEMKDMSLTSWALLRSKLCLALLTRHLCFRRIWWIMKTASFTVQGTKAIFHWHLYALAAAKEKCMKKLRWLFSSQVISAGKKNNKKKSYQIFSESKYIHIDNGMHVGAHVHRHVSVLAVRGEVGFSVTRMHRKAGKWRGG